MALNDILERASGEETRPAVGDSIYKKLLPGLGYELWLGKNHGTARNQFWRDPVTDTYFADAFHNILNIMGNYITTLQNIISKKVPKSIEERIEMAKQMMDAVRELGLYLKEHLDVADAVKIDESQSVLGITNREVMDDIRRMRSLSFPLNTLAPGTNKYKRRAQILLNGYKEIQERYMKYRHEIESRQFTQSHHPPPQ